MPRRRRGEARAAGGGSVRKVSPSAPNASAATQPPKRLSKAAVQRAWEKAAADRFRRSQAQKAAWARRKAAAAQAAMAETEKARVERELAEARQKKVDQAKRDLVETKKRVKKIKKSGNLRPLEKANLDRQVMAAEQAVQFAQEPGGEERYQERQKILSEVKLGRELLGDRVEKFYKEQSKEKKVMPLSPRHEPGKTWRYESSYRKGYVLDRKVGKLLDEDHFEETIERISQVAEEASIRQPTGKLYISLSFYEYGKGIPKSSHQLKQDEFGDYWQAFDGTGALSAAGSLDEFEGKVREMLLDRVSRYGENHAVLLDGFQVKAFYDKTPEEIVEYRRVRRQKRRALLKEKRLRFFSSQDRGHIHTLYVTPSRTLRTQILETTRDMDHRHAVVVPALSPGKTVRVKTQVANGHTHTFDLTGPVPKEEGEK